MKTGFLGQPRLGVFHCLSAQLPAGNEWFELDGSEKLVSKLALKAESGSESELHLQATPCNIGSIGSIE